jgi:glycosyltransferase involved in cell wall biosynthesis
VRIVHVVTLVGDDGAYGGPVSVATGHLGELAARGHEVELLALWRGAAAAPGELDGVPLRTRRARALVPGQGFLGLFHPLFALDLWRRLRGADVVHVHAGRDLVSLAALAVAVLRRRPFVVQTHGMVQPRRAAVARLFDRVYVPLLRRARRALVLTAQEEAGLREVFGRKAPPLLRLPNGVRVTDTGEPRADSGDVLYLARLHERKRPETFVEMAALVHKEAPGARFTMHGSDEGSLAAVLDLVEARGLTGTVTYAGPLDHATAVRRTAAASVYVLPSVNEPFPMSLLEALAAGTPSVCTESCGIAPELAARRAALVTDGSPESLAEAVLSLLNDPALRHRLARAGHRAIDEAFSITAVADRLETVYTDAGVSASAPPPAGR